MRNVKPLELVRPVVGVLYSDPADWPETEQWLQTQWGVPEAISEVMPFHHTSYYVAEMGPVLHRRWMVFGGWYDPVEVRYWKLRTIAWEEQHLRPDGGRRVNLDPGYLGLSQLVLASTKPVAHRVYLGDGIYAEVTLSFHRGAYQPLVWTYPDYTEAAPWFTSLRHSRQEATEA